MRSKSFVILAALTAIMVVAALVAAVTQSAPRTVLADREAAFPDLVEQINDVAAIEIASAGERFTILGEGDNWGIEEKQNYAVPRKTVRDFILDLANLKLVESKTARPDRYSRLKVEDVEEEDAESRAVVVFGKTGKELARAIIGRRKYFLYVDGRGGTYIRRGGEARAWLAEGEMDFGARPHDWARPAGAACHPRRTEGNPDHTADAGDLGRAQGNARGRALQRAGCADGPRSQDRDRGRPARVGRRKV